MKAPNYSKFSLLGITLILILTCVSSLLAHDIIVKRNSNFRSEPTSASDRLIRLEQDDILILLEPEKQNGYYHAIYKGFTGWVWARNVTVIQEYERTQWKHWIDADRDKQDTREEVLIHESELPITFEENDSTKKILSGRWTCPYTGQVFTDPKDLDVDHVVPLGNAHQSGGWMWDFEKRKAYANFLDDPNHLIAVDKAANRAKGSKGPDEWMPSNTDFQCDYVNIWESIKLRWNLTISELEADKIREVREDCSE